MQLVHLRQPAQAGRLGREASGGPRGGSPGSIAGLGGFSAGSRCGRGPTNGSLPDGLVPGMTLILNFGERTAAIGQLKAVVRDAVLAAKAAQVGYTDAEQVGEPDRKSWLR